MGKVYEALSRAQNDAVEFDLFDEVEDEDGPNQEDVQEDVQEDIQEDDQEDDQEAELDAISGGLPEKFHFMRYSLGVTAMVAKTRAGNGHASRALVSRPVCEPGSELTIDLARLDPHLAAFNNLDPQSSQEYNKLALSLVSKAAEKGFKRVLVASAQRGEGRTSVTLNLACALARARQRVLIVDCDLLNPSVMRSIGLHAQIGMREAFERGMPPNAATIAIRPYGFNVLPTTRPVGNPAELFAAPGFWKMLQSLDAGHDFILFDSSPLATGGDSSLLVRFTDTTLMVVRAGYTTSAEMARAIAPFAQDDILGVVMNRTKH